MDATQKERLRELKMLQGAKIDRERLTPAFAAGLGVPPDHVIFADPRTTQSHVTGISQLLADEEELDSVARSPHRHSLRTDDKSLFSTVLRELEGSVGDEEVYLHLMDTESTGALITSLAMTLRRWDSLIRSDDDLLHVATPDLGMGFLLETYTRRSATGTVSVVSVFDAWGFGRSAIPAR